MLYSFTGGADGGGPSAGVVLDSAGNLYGTTSLGGAAGRGVVFKLAPNGQETVLYNFPSGSGNNIYSDLIFDAAGNLYGTSSYGGNAGCASGCGFVFKVDPTGQETTLWAFTGGADGANPSGPLILDAAGNLYGTALNGGTNGGGVLFELLTAAPKY